MRRNQHQRIWFLMLLTGFQISSSDGMALILPVVIPAPTSTATTLDTTTTTTITLSSSRSRLQNAPISQIEGSFLLSTLTTTTTTTTVNDSPSSSPSSSSSSLPFSTKKGFQNDQVIRILDANTIKLQKNGIVTIAGVRMPTPGKSSGNFQFPSCLSKGPTYKIRQLLPAKTNVLIKIVNNNNSQQQPPAVILIRNDDFLFVNQELVKSGFGKVQQPKVILSDPIMKEYLDYEKLKALQENAQSKGLGIFQRCQEEENGDASSSSTAIGGGDAPFFEAEFEPLERTMETKWTESGGIQVLKQQQGSTTTSSSSNEPPKNPGDKKGCSDFETYEDALRWFEFYEPYYGDVAKLDRNGDGVPCPGLPHTKNQDQYRMKVPRRTGIGEQ